MTREERWKALDKILFGVPKGKIHILLICHACAKRTGAYMKNTKSVIQCGWCGEEYQITEVMLQNR